MTTLPDIPIHWSRTVFKKWKYLINCRCSRFLHGIYHYNGFSWSGICSNADHEHFYLPCFTIFFYHFVHTSAIQLDNILWRGLSKFFVFVTLWRTGGCMKKPIFIFEARLKKFLSSIFRPSYINSSQSTLIITGPST